MVDGLLDHAPRPARSRRRCRRWRWPRRPSPRSPPRPAGPGAASSPAPAMSPAEVVDHDLGALLGQHQGVLPPDAPAGARDQADATFTDPAHRQTLPRRRQRGSSLAPSPETGESRRVTRRFGPITPQWSRRMRRFDSPARRSLILIPARDRGRRRRRLGGRRARGPRRQGRRATSPLAGAAIGGSRRTTSTRHVAELAESYLETPVEIESGDRTLETTVGDLGGEVDQEATVAAALDIDAGPASLDRAASSRTRSPRSSSPCARTPSTRELATLEGVERTNPVEPQIQHTSLGFAVGPWRGRPRRPRPTPVIDQVISGAATGEDADHGRRRRRARSPPASPTRTPRRWPPRPTT